MRLSTKIFITAIVLASAFDYLFFVYRLGINLPIAEILFVCACVFLARSSGHAVPLRAWVTAGFAFLYSLSLVVWTSDIGSDVASVAFIIANLFFVAFVMGHHGVYRHPFEMVCSGTTDLCVKLFSRISIARELKPRRLSDNSYAVMKGIIFLIPILLILSAFFVSADPVFESYVRLLFDWVWIDIEFGRLVFIAFFTVMFSLFFAVAFWERFSESKLSELQPRFKTESKVILIGVIVLFTSFIITQAYALFGGEGALRDLGLTYSQYARGGFFQLVVSSILVIGLILTLRLIHGERANKFLTLLNAILTVETFLILISAFYRLSLYIGAYGYTSARLFGCWTIFTLAVLISLLFVNVIRESSQIPLMRNGLFTLAISCLLFVWIPIDTLTVRLNIARDSVDPYMFWAVSEEAFPTVKDFFDITDGSRIDGLVYPKPTTEQYLTGGFANDCEIREELRSFYQNRLFDNNSTTVGWEWQEWNWSRARLPDRYIDDPPAPDWLVAPSSNECQK